VRAVECYGWRALQEDGWVLLDVRPRFEAQRVRPTTRLARARRSPASAARRTVATAAAARHCRTRR